MRSPLTVRISDGVRDQHVTRYVKDLRFTKTAPGGHHSASMQIDAPEGLFPDLGNADRLFVYDGRNGETKWDGYVENPGRTTVAGGARYDLSAMGGLVLATDNARAVVFVDRDLAHSHWKKIGDTASAQMGVDQAAAPAIGPGFKAQFNPGTPVGTGSHVGMLNSALIATGQPIHKIIATVLSGKDDADYKTSANLYDEFLTVLASYDVADFSDDFPASMSITINPGDFEFGQPAFSLTATRFGGATNVVDDLTWAVFAGITVRPCLQDASGDYVVAISNAVVFAKEVVDHLVGSGALQVDPVNAVIESTSYSIRQLAYLDGAKPLQILDDLSLYEPDMLWEILESNAAGLHRFAYRAWPTTPRYEISGREFTETGGEADLCNRIVVNWTDETGAKQTTERVAVVEALGSRTKDAEPITLPDGQGNQLNAERIGDQTLAGLNSLTHSGTATIRRPILDRLTGRMVMPWEIEPGYLVRVRDIGVDLRMPEMTYDDTNVTANLKLGTPPLTQAQRIARLGRR